MLMRATAILQTGPDGEEHTTRTVTTEGEQVSSQDPRDPSDDLLDAVLSPLMGGLPDFGRIIEAAEQEPRRAGQPSAAPQEAPQVTQAPKEVTTDEAKQAVKAAVKAEGLDVGSPEKRKASTSPAPFPALGSEFSG